MFLKNCRQVAALLMVAVLAAGAATGAEQRSPVGVSSHGDSQAPDISGLWLGTLTGIPGEGFAPNSGPADGRPPTYWAPWPLPYTPKFQKLYDDRVAAAKKGVQLGDLSAQCLPFGMPRILISKVYPDEIVQTPGQVTFYIFGTVPIVVWTDGRPHPKDLAPGFNGHSIGHWVNDTLYVDTVGVLGVTPLDSYRNPHGDKLRMEWTVRRVANDTLHLTVTLHDEEAFTEPVTTTNIWRRKSGDEWAVLDDQSCFENNGSEAVGALAPGFVKF